MTRTSVETTNIGRPYIERAYGLLSPDRGDTSILQVRKFAMKMPNGKALRDCSLTEIEINSAYLLRRLNTLRAKAPIRQVRAALKSGGASFAISKGLAIGLPRKKINAVISAGL